MSSSSHPTLERAAAIRGITILKIWALMQVGIAVMACVVFAIGSVIESLVCR